MHATSLAFILTLGLPPTPPTPPVVPPPFTEAEVRPWFEAGSAARALSAFEGQRWTEAAALFGKSPGREARLLRGLALIHADRGTEAVEVLAGLDDHFPEIADRIRFWRGKAWDSAGDREKAAAVYDSVLEGSLLRADAQMARARELAALGDREQALAILEPFTGAGAPPDLGRPDSAASALLLAGKLRADSEQESDQARRAFLDCWAGHPLSPEAAECLAALRELPEPHGAPPGDEDLLRHSESLLEMNRNRPALQDLERLVARLPAPGPNQPFACRAGFALGKAYRKERHQTKAVAVLGKVVDQCTDPDLRVRALYVLGSAAAVVVPEQAVAVYDRLATEFPAHSFADDALFFEADLLAQADRPEEAMKKLDQLLAEHPQGDYRSEALFRIAWLSRAGGNLDAAIETLSSLEGEVRDSDPYEYARAAYWRGRLLADRGGPEDAKAARAVWSELAERLPAEYYGLLARARLRDGGVPVRLASLKLPAQTSAFRWGPGWLREDPHFRAGVLLLRLGLMKSAADELGAAAAHRPAGVGDPTEPVFLLSELLDRAGDHRSAHNLVRTAGRALWRLPEGENLRLWQVAYPPAFRDKVMKWAPRGGVPVDLLQAVMREESAFDPLAVSTAGAVGLTQLMPSGAVALAKKHKLRRPSQSELMDPDVNIRIGALELGEYLHEFHGSPALALAAYNAGTRPVRAWLRQRGSLALDEWVEEIPYRETRNYVKRVLRSYGAYRLLYGRPSDGEVALGQRLPSGE